MNEFNFSEKEKEALHKVIKDLKVLPGVNVVELQTLDKESFLEAMEELKQRLANADEMERMYSTGGEGHVFFFANPDIFKDLVFLIQVDFENGSMEPRQVAQFIMFALVARLKELKESKGK